MISVDAALEIFRTILTPLPAEACPTVDALQRVLAADADYADDLPRFDQSAMDGYALRAADVAEAMPERPVTLTLGGVVSAGPRQVPVPLQPGGAVRIFTGAPLPAGADCMIPQEQAVVDGERLIFTAPWTSGRNIRWHGEEARAGARLGVAGTRIGPGLLAALVNAGVAQVQVARKPRIRLLVTGDELRPSGSVLRFGEIIDSNGPLVRALLQRWGYPPPEVHHVPDRPEAVLESLSAALENSDLVLSCGGTSVGDYDFLPVTAERLGLRQVFWKIAQKPGKPLYFAVGPRSALLALPGNPGAVLVNLLVHGRTLLDRLEGTGAPGPRWNPGRLQADVERDRNRERLLRMKLEYAPDGCAHLRPLPQQDSHMLGNLGVADVLVRVAAGDGPCTAGTPLPWMALQT